MQNWNGTLEPERFMLLGRKSGLVFDGSSCGGKDLTVAHHQASPWCQLLAPRRYLQRPLKSRSWLAARCFDRMPVEKYGCGTVADRGKPARAKVVVPWVLGFPREEFQACWMTPLDWTRFWVGVQFVTHWSDSPGRIVDPLSPQGRWFSTALPDRILWLRHMHGQAPMIYSCGVIVCGISVLEWFFGWTLDIGQGPRDSRNLIVTVEPCRRIRVSCNVITSFPVIINPYQSLEFYILYSV
jgi:hypothetical protein